MKLLDLYARYRSSEDALHRDSEQDVRINREDVAEPLATHSERYMHWARLAAMAESDAEAAEHDLDKVEAECQLLVRKAHKGEKVREDEIKAAVALRDEFLRAQATHREQLRFFRLLKSIEKAMQQRFGLLQSLNSRQCRELSFYPEDRDEGMARRLEGDRRQDRQQQKQQQRKDLVANAAEVLAQTRRTQER